MVIIVVLYELTSSNLIFVSIWKAINKLPESVKSTIEMKEEPVEIENYMNVISALYNQNWIGFQLDSKRKFKRFEF